MNKQNEDLLVLYQKYIELGNKAKSPDQISQLKKQIEKIIGELSQSNLNKPDYRICPIPGFFYY